MHTRLALAMMAADVLILNSALELDTKMTVDGLMPDFAIVDDLPKIKENTTLSGRYFNPEGIVENNNWRKSKKRRFNGYWSSNT